MLKGFELIQFNMDMDSNGSSLGYQEERKSKLKDLKPAFKINLSIG